MQESHATESSVDPDTRKITGVLLAGGKGLRMGGKDKGLLVWEDRPLAIYALEALAEVAGPILINANRNIAEYERFGYPVFADGTEDFQGPLAGILKAMEVATTPFILTVPCDVPRVRGRHLWRLWSTFRDTPSDLCAPHDGKRMHPVFLLADCRLKAGLAEYLASGGRKILTWVNAQRLAIADFSGEAEIFANINSPSQLTNTFLTGVEPHGDEASS
jgi:molybdopterin-guanine dinucleotide biosynthesis protein A